MTEEQYQAELSKEHRQSEKDEAYEKEWGDLRPMLIVHSSAVIQKVTQPKKLLNAIVTAEGKDESMEFSPSDYATIESCYKAVTDYVLSFNKELQNEQ